MRVHFREKYSSKGEEILYVTPAGMPMFVYLDFIVILNKHSLNIQTMRQFRYANNN